jgi:hypothetical protein
MRLVDVSDARRRRDLVLLVVCLIFLGIYVISITANMVMDFTIKYWNGLAQGSGLTITINELFKVVRRRTRARNTIYLEGSLEPDEEDEITVIDNRVKKTCGNCGWRVNLKDGLGERCSAKRNIDNSLYAGTISLPRIHEKHKCFWLTKFNDDRWKKDSGTPDADDDDQAHVINNR